VALAATALACWASSAATAQAAPHWYAEGRLVSGTVRVSSVHRGEMSVHLPTVTLECQPHVTAGSVTNPPGGEAGVGELSETKASKNRPIAFCEATREGPPGCSSIYHIKASTLPVRTHLAIESSLAGVRDVIEGTPLRLECELETVRERFAEVGVITGALKPKVGHGQLEFEGEGTSVELFKENAEVWGTESGHNEVVTATLTGAVELRGKGRRNRTITAE
jgi:hypothetical protein